uniref:Uncharacterized protein n=1 Tax=Haptolina ericina TaxID=156174 RepID=A0A7S3BVN4_9EUKA
MEEAATLRRQGRVALLAGSSEAQVRLSLSEVEDVEVLQLRDAVGVFGGWDEETHARQFDERMRRAGIDREDPPSWCCSSYDPAVAKMELELPPITARDREREPRCNGSVSYEELAGKQRGCCKYKIRYPPGC